MKILLIGEYSNVHATLAKGLNHLGHEAMVVSNGDDWKNYHRDIDVSRTYGPFGGLKLYAKLLTLLPKLRGFDIVQLINPMFFELKAERLRFFYDYLRRHNKYVVLGAFGMDYYWVHECITRFPLRYSDFNIGKHVRTDEESQRYIKDWVGTAKGDWCQYVAKDADKIIAGLYEYWACYQPIFPEKTVFCPFPIIPSHTTYHPFDGKLHLFIGINKMRNRYKGTDIMLKAAQKIVENYPEKADLQVAESVPFEDYVKMMGKSDVILDQLYSYTPSMNPLEAMSQGLICVGGGEPENYDIINEHELRPIINVELNESSVYQALYELILHPERINTLKRESMAYIKRHHDYINVAQKYIAFYEQLDH